MHQFKTEQFLPIDKIKAWDFFSSAKNLAVITPAKLDFKILSAFTEGEIFEGMKIDYTLKPLFGVAVHWQTEIGKVEYQHCFTDKQLTGPYKIWEHTDRKSTRLNSSH